TGVRGWVRRGVFDRGEEEAADVKQQSDQGHDSVDLHLSASSLRGTRGEILTCYDRVFAGKLHRYRLSALVPLQVGVKCFLSGASLMRDAQPMKTLIRAIIAAYICLASAGVAAAQSNWAVAPDESGGGSFLGIPGELRWR